MMSLGEIIGWSFVRAVLMLVAVRWCLSGLNLIGMLRDR